MALSLQCYLGCNQAATCTLTRTDTHHPLHDGSIRSACHQPGSSHSCVIRPSCHKTGERKTDSFCTHCEISVWLPAHPASKHLFHLSFHPPFSFLPDIVLLLTPLFFTTLLKFPDSVYPAICHHSAFISPPSTIKLKEA